MYGYSSEMEGALIGQDGHRYETDYREVWTQPSYENRAEGGAVTAKTVGELVDRLACEPRDRPIVTTPKYENDAVASVAVCGRRSMCRSRRHGCSGDDSNGFGLVTVEMRTARRWSTSGVRRITVPVHGLPRPLQAQAAPIREMTAWQR